MTPDEAMDLAIARVLGAGSPAPRQQDFLDELVADVRPVLRGGKGWGQITVFRIAEEFFRIVDGAEQDYLCPCMVCPRCGHVDDDHGHPLDGLSYGCRRCHEYEWWCHVGPHMDGRHPTSDEECKAWAAHDTAVLRSNP